MICWTGPRNAGGAATDACFAYVNLNPRQLGATIRRIEVSRKLAMLVISATLLTLSAHSGTSSTFRITAVEPATVRVGSTITLKGENLTRDNVAGVFVSNASDDFPAPIVSQMGTRIVVQIPKVKAGDYNISIQVKRDVLIQPIRLTVRD